MKLLLPIVVLLAGGGLAWVALRAPTQDYVAPQMVEVEPGSAAPASLSGEVPAGYVVRSFDVEGMCCQGCTGKLYHSLFTVRGVGEAAVSFDEGAAHVVAHEDVAVASLEEALSIDKYSGRLRN